MAADPAADQVADSKTSRLAHLRQTHLALCDVKGHLRKSALKPIGYLLVIGGIAGMLTVYSVHHDPAVAGVLLHQAIGLLVPLAGGTIAYLIIRRKLGPLRVNAHDGGG
jgi:hypothetical protein